MCDTTAEEGSNLPPELEVIKDIPSYRVILKAILRYQIQQLLTQLSDYTEEESIILSTCVSEGTFSYLGTRSGKTYLEQHKELKTSFMNFCMQEQNGQQPSETPDSSPSVTSKRPGHVNLTLLRKDGSISTDQMYVANQHTSTAQSRVATQPSSNSKKQTQLPGICMPNVAQVSKSSQMRGRPKPVTKRNFISSSTNSSMSPSSNSKKQTQFPEIGLPNAAPVVRSGRKRGRPKSLSNRNSVASSTNPSMSPVVRLQLLPRNITPSVRVKPSIKNVPSIIQTRSGKRKASGLLSSSPRKRSTNLESSSHQTASSAFRSTNNETNIRIRSVQGAPQESSQTLSTSEPEVKIEVDIIEPFAIPETETNNFNNAVSSRTFPASKTTITEFEPSPAQPLQESINRNHLYSTETQHYMAETRNSSATRNTLATQYSTLAQFLAGSSVDTQNTAATRNTAATQNTATQYTPATQNTAATQNTPATQYTPTTPYTAVTQKTAGNRYSSGFSAATQYSSATLYSPATQNTASQYTAVTQNTVGNQHSSGFSPATQYSAATLYSPATQNTATQYTAVTQNTAGNQHSSGFSAATQYSPATLYSPANQYSTVSQYSAGSEAATKYATGNQYLTATQFSAEKSTIIPYSIETLYSPTTQNSDGSSAAIQYSAATQFSPVTQYMHTCASLDVEVGQQLLWAENQQLLRADNQPLLGADNQPLLGADNQPLLGADNQLLLGADNQRQNSPGAEGLDTSAGLEDMIIKMEESEDDENDTDGDQPRIPEEGDVDMEPTASDDVTKRKLDKNVSDTSVACSTESIKNIEAVQKTSENSKAAKDTQEHLETAENTPEKPKAAENTQENPKSAHNSQEHPKSSDTPEDHEVVHDTSEHPKTTENTPKDPKAVHDTSEHLKTTKKRPLTKTGDILGQTKTSRSSLTQTKEAETGASDDDNGTVISTLDMECQTVDVNEADSDFDAAVAGVDDDSDYIPDAADDDDDGDDDDGDDDGDMDDGPEDEVGQDNGALDELFENAAEENKVSTGTETDVSSVGSWKQRRAAFYKNIQLNDRANASKKWQKLKFCPFCKKMNQSKLSEHILAKHMDEEKLREITAMPKGSKERFEALGQLRIEGRYQHNVQLDCRTKTSTKGSKLKFCPFCKKFQSKMTRHILTRHKKKERIREIIALPKGSRKRIEALGNLRNEGNFEHNVQVLQEGKGTLVVSKRPNRTNISAMHYLPCVFCLQFIYYANIHKHHVNCSLRPKMMSRDLNAGRNGLIMLQPFMMRKEERQRLLQELMQIITSMRKLNKVPKLRETCSTDELILEFGICTFQRVGNEKMKGHYNKISLTNKMRLLAQLLAKLNENKTARGSLSDFICVKKFAEVAAAVKALSRNSNKLAGLMEDHLKQICLLKSSLARKKNDLRKLKEATDFQAYFSHTWESACLSPSPCEAEDVEFLTTDDLPTLTTFAKAEIQRLVDDPDLTCEKYRHLTRALFVRVLLVNARAVGEVEDLMQPQFESRLHDCDTQRYKDKEASLNLLEKALSKRLDLMDVHSKPAEDQENSHVLLPSDVVHGISYLLSHRESLEAMSYNRFLFAETRFRHLDGSTALKKMCSACPRIGKPKVMRTGDKQRYMAAVCQINEMTEVELQVVVEHFDKVLKIRTSLEKLQTSAVDRRKAAKLLLSDTQKLKRLEGKALEDMDFKAIAEACRAEDDSRVTADSVAIETETSEKADGTARNESDAENDSDTDSYVLDDETGHFESKSKSKPQDSIVEETDTDDEPEKQSQQIACPPRIKRKRWSEEENRDFRRAFNTQIKNKVNVTWLDIKTAHEKYPSLKDRTPMMIRTRVNNIILGKCKL